MKRLCIFLLLITLSLLITGCSINTMFYDNADEYVKGAGVISDEITKLEIEWIAGEVDVKFHDGQDVVIEESGPEAASQPLYHRVEDGELSIKYCKSGIGLNAHFGKELTVLLPRYTSLDSLIISSASGDVTVSEINSVNAYISSASGNITLDNATVGRNLEASTASGSISVKLLGECKSIELESASGDINAHLEDTREVIAEAVSGAVVLRAYSLPTAIDAESVSGDLTLYIPEGDPFSFEAQSISGSVGCEFGAAKSGDRYTVDGGSTDYTFESVSGNIHIRKLK